METTEILAATKTAIAKFDFSTFESNGKITILNKKRMVAGYLIPGDPVILQHRSLGRKALMGNHGYYSAEEFTTLADALAYGKSKCFEFALHQGEEVHGAWSPIGGFRAFTPAAERLYAYNTRTFQRRK